MDAELVSLLERIRVFVSASHFEDLYGNPKEALAEISRHLEALHAGGDVDLSHLHVLFAPTGSLQEVSQENGWGEDFLTLSAEFDRIAAQWAGGVSSGV